MRVIDLLNKIANGEKVPKKIKVYDDSFTYIDKWEQYTSDNTDKPLLYIISAFNYSGLNNEVEIIEEKEMCHKCGKYPAEYNQTYCEFCLGISEEDKKIEKIDPLEKEYMTLDDIKFTFSNSEMAIVHKINEIIDYINGSDKE